MTDESTVLQGFAEGYDVEAAVAAAMRKVEDSNTHQDFKVLEITFSRGGVIGPSTTVTLEYSSALDPT